MNIRVYTTGVCPNCKQLKQALGKQNKTYQEVNMTTAEALTELNMNGVFTLSAPVLQIKNKFYTHDKLFKDDNLDGELLNEILNEVPA
ncbi:MAG: hypothetical protein DNFNHJIP_00531 [Candidatus Argoarchaeum ethanivorans]|uniref:Glutaredoxin domain-containing protein n=1 Tax=Candidatus Argoarchaeum ethanivorans TaxID=2608793 RepID=A0A812A1U0_9EURY|nr:MAG: hypothetical protein DNFNHJIP_00531 [Candidatus Argoarchaeum ethanivorans]